jgi:lipopolysaccharide heptosyltransferase II
MRVLIVRLRQIGDVVFTTPVVRVLRERHPRAYLAYLVEPAAAPVIAGNPHLDDIIVAPRGRGLAGLRQEAALVRRLRAGRFDLAIDLHGGPRASLLTWLSGAPARIGYEVAGRAWMYTKRIPRPRALRARHSVKNQADVLAALDLSPDEVERFAVEMTADPQARQSADGRLDAAGVPASASLIVVHVSAGNPFRRWPLGAFASVAAELAAGDRTRRIIITSGPSEQDAAGQVIDEARSRLGEARAHQVVAAAEFSLAELRALMDRAALFIGGDSGPLHVAATSRVPIVGLYGPTLPARSAPWRPAQVPAEAVEIHDLPCRPCDQRHCVPGDFRCLAWIQPREVVDAAERAMTRVQPSTRTAGQTSG